MNSSTLASQERSAREPVPREILPAIRQFPVTHFVNVKVDFSEIQFQNHVFENETAALLPQILRDVPAMNTSRVADLVAKKLVQEIRTVHWSV